MHYLFDTNVAVVANNKSSAGPTCVLAAIGRLEQLQAGEVLVLDDAFHILSEYDRNLSASGQPGPGDEFYLWALQNHTNPRHCELVFLDMAPDGRFAAFPAAPELTKFDLSDRKFVAAALTHPANPPVVNATDKDWHEHRAALTSHGIRIEFLCPDEMTRLRRL